MPEEGPRENIGGGGEPSANNGNGIVEAENESDVALAAQTEGVGVNPVKETAKRQSDKILNQIRNWESPVKPTEAICGAGNHYVVIEHVLEEEAAAAAPLPPTSANCLDGEKRPGFKNQKPATPKKPYACLFCPVEFHTSTNLVNHLRVHTRERPFWCGVCGKKFAEKYALARHRLIHTDEKPHECELCEKRFNDPSSLRRHRRIHSGEKPWKCPDCGKAFGREDHFTEHRVVHTGERAFKCRFCDKSYPQMSGLRRHRKKAHTAQK